MLTEKGFRSFHMWCIDTIVLLIPIALDKSEHILVVIVVFKKWVEMEVFILLDLIIIALWIHR